MEHAERSAGYRITFPRPDDKLIERNRVGRGIWFIIFSILMFAVPTWFVSYWASFIGFPVVGGLVGFGIGGYIASRLIPDHFLINNAEMTAYVTENLFGGAMVAYGPGLHPSYCWEQRNFEGNYSLEVLALPFEAKISTLTSRVMVHCEYEYAIDLGSIVRAIGIDPSTVEDGFVTFMENFLTSKCADQTADWVRAHIDELNRDLSNEFERKAGSFGERYGFITVSLVINKISFPDSVQGTRDAIDKAATMHTVVARLYGITPEALTQKLEKKEISIEDYNKMLNRAIVESGGAKMSLNVIEADIPAMLGKLVGKFAETKGGE